MNKTNAPYYNDIRIAIPKEKTQENMKQESFFYKLLRRLNIL